ncbi:MAG TPA: hypothetical protein VGK73_31720 [Polyangiaceae bacterium]
MITLWPAEGLTVLDHNGDVIPVNGVNVTAELFASFYLSRKNAGLLLDYDPIGTGGVPNTLYSAGALDAVSSDAVLATIRGDLDGQQAKTNDNNFWKWVAASTATPAAASSTGTGVLAPDVGTAGRWLQQLPTGSGTSTLAGDTTGPSGSNTLARMKGVALVSETAGSGKVDRVSGDAGTTGTVQAVFAATIGSGLSIPVGAQVRHPTNHYFYDVTVGGSESGGSITVTLSGSGTLANISAGATVTLAVPIFNGLGSVTSAGTVSAPGISGLVDRWTAQDVTQPKKYQLVTLPNGDARKGIYPGATTDSRAGIQAAINQMVIGDSLEIGPGNNGSAEYYVGDTPDATYSLAVDRGRFSSLRGVTIFGNNAYADNSGGCRILYMGAGGAGRTVFNVSTTRSTFSGFSLNVRPGFTGPQSLLRVNDIVGAPIQNFIDFERLYFSGQNATIAHLVELGDGGPTTGNIENMQFLACRFDSPSQSCVRSYSSIQPYNTMFLRSQFIGATAGAGVYGTALWSSTVSSNYVFISCDIQQLESWFYSQAETRVSFESTQSERCKKTVYMTGNFASVSISGATRFNPFDINVASSGPVGFSANDQRIIDMPGNGMISVRNLNARGDGGNHPDARIFVGRGVSVSIRDSYWPSANVVQRDIISGTLPEGQTVIENVIADVSLAASPVNEYPTGTQNSQGKVWLHGTATSVQVSLPNLEAASGAEYAIELTEENSVGTPLAWEPARVVTRSTDYFEIQVPTAPGAGNARSWSWRSHRRTRTFDSPTDFSELYLWLRSDSGITPGATIPSWTDQARGEVFNFSGSQPAYTASSANLNSLPAVILTAGTTQAMQSAALESTYRFLHDGTISWTVIAVVYNSLSTSGDIMGYTIGTKISTSNTYGFSFVNDHSGTNRLHNRIAAPGSGSSGVVTTYVPGKRMWFARRSPWVTSSGADGPALIRTSQPGQRWQDTSTFAGAAASGACENTFRLQNQSTTQNLEIAEIIVIKRGIENVEAESFYQNYLQPRYGGLGAP